MSGMPHEPLSQADVLLEGFLALDTPEGFRAELIEGEIVVTPPPDGDHEDCISMIMKQVIRHARTDMDFSGNKGLKLRSGGGCPKNHVIPDGTFAPTGLRLYRGADPWMPCEGVALVVEVTSSKPAADRTGTATPGDPSPSTCWSTARSPRSRCSATRRGTTTASTARSRSARPSVCRRPSRWTWRPTRSSEPPDRPVGRPPADG